MTELKKVRSERILMGRLAQGADLLDEITEICAGDNIRLARIEGLGSVTRACLGFYHHEAREYRLFTVNEPLEIVSLTGNASLREGRPFVHAHAVFSDIAGKTYGGHLSPGTIIFACEVVIDVLEGAEFTREFDSQTGLQLWKPADGGGDGTGRE